FVGSRQSPESHANWKWQSGQVNSTWPPSNAGAIDPPSTWQATGNPATNHELKPISPIRKRAQRSTSRRVRIMTVGGTTEIELLSNKRQTGDIVHFSVMTVGIPIALQTISSQGTT